MKYIIILLLVFPIYLKSQVIFDTTKISPIKIIKLELDKNRPSLLLDLLSGVADGINQTLEFHYASFKKFFPNVNDQFWNPAISWTNKYKDNNASNGPKFLGSTGVLVFVTDGYHLTRFVDHIFLFSSIGLKLNLVRQKWYMYAIQIVEYWIVNRVGFYMVYNAPTLWGIKF